MPLTRINITKSIIMADARRVENNKPPLRNLLSLCHELEAKDEDTYEAMKVYYVLHRAEKTGVRKLPPKLIQDLLEILMVNEEELMIWPRV